MEINKLQKILKEYKNSEYKLGKKVGEGTFGTVFSLKRKGKGDCVLKVLDLQTRIDTICAEVCNPVIREKFLLNVKESFFKDVHREIEFLKTFRYADNIVQYVDSFEHFENNELKAVFIIEKRYDGSLNDYIKNTSISEMDVIKIGLDISNALIELEKKDILHRDIKPSNILIKKQPTANEYFLADFGVSGVQNQRTEFGTSTSKLTCAGTAPFEAPEIRFRRPTVNKTADIYSLGASLYYLLNGISINTLRYDLNEKPLLPNNVSSELAAIIFKATAENPRERYLHAQELYNAFHALATHRNYVWVQESIPRTYDKTKTFYKKYNRNDKHLQNGKIETDTTTSPTRKNTKPFSIIVLALIASLFFLIWHKHITKSDLFNMENTISVQESYVDMGINELSSDNSDNNYTKAIEYFEKGVAAGDSRAYGWLGYCYYYGYGVNQDYDKAVEYFEIGIEFEDPSAYLWLGHCYYNGYGVNQNYNKAVEYFEIAANTDNPYACEMLAYCYLTGRGINQDYDKSIHFYKKAIELNSQNSAEIYATIGILYHDKNDYSHAIEYFNKGIELENAIAYRELGNCYYFGHGVEKNDEIALEYFKKAAHLGDTYAIYHLNNSNIE